jgi:hypothetical protein
MHYITRLSCTARIVPQNSRSGLIRIDSSGLIVPDFSEDIYPRLTFYTLRSYLVYLNTKRAGVTRMHSHQFKLNNTQRHLVRHLQNKVCHIYYRMSQFEGVHQLCLSVLFVLRCSISYRLCIKVPHVFVTNLE